MTEIFLSLGSNISPRVEYLRRGVELLKEHLTDVRVSSIYETRPQENTDQRDFLNAVLSGYSPLPPNHWLRIIRKVEQSCGRNREGIPWKGPRTLDVDILFYGNHFIESADLTIPHPALTERQFVLIPLLELQPDMTHLLSGVSLKKYNDTLMDQGVEKTSIPW